MELPGGPTQPEVMAVSLAKLDVQPGDTAADIGCGTDTVTKAIAALAGRTGHVYAVDRRTAAVSITKETCAGLSQVEVIEGENAAFLAAPHKKSTAPSVAEAATFPLSSHDWMRKDAETLWSTLF